MAQLADLRKGYDRAGLNEPDGGWAVERLSP
jgi:hypothetical protein